jgi:hypothetical protein
MAFFFARRSQQPAIDPLKLHGAESGRREFSQDAA